MRESSAFNFRASEFLLLRATIRCPTCRHATRVQALVLPPGYAALDEPQDAHPGRWHTVPVPVVLFEIECIDAQAAGALKARHAQLQPPEAPASGWRNRCEVCRAPVEEADLHAEPGAAFMPRSTAAASALNLERVCEPIRVGAAGSSLDPPWFDDFLRG